MKKKYLTTPEEILALKDSDTKIYCDKENGYYQFINGNLVAVYENGFLINPWVCPKAKPYILVEEPVEEVTEKDVGCLCLFWDNHIGGEMYGILEDFGEDTQTKRLSYYCKDARWYDNCHRLTPAEVAEITGYKVEE